MFLLIFLYASKRESEKVEARSRKDASEVKLLVETKMLLYERLILSVTGLYRSNTEVLLDDFNEFIEASSVGLKGFNGISWIPKLQGKDLPAFQTWLEQQGVTDFALRKLDGKPIRDILPNETYYPLTFYTRREIAGFRGVDLGQSAQRLSVMLAAQESLHSQTIANISFIGNRAGDKGSILIQPIVKRDKSNEKTNVIGFICFGFRPAEAFAEALAHAEELNLDLQVSNSKGDILLSTNSAGSRPFRPNSYLSSETMMNWQADQWKIRISPKQVYFAKNRSWDTWAILMIGLTFCAAIQVFILVITGSHYKVSVQVRERTKELDDSRKNLMIARDEAIKANDAKGIFLANMSHEIRTPLNGIIGITKLLAATPLNSKQRMWLHHLEVSNRGLMYLINDILDLSKIEAGALTLRSEPMDPKQIVDESIQTLSALAEAKDLKITLRVDPEMPERIQGDAFRIRQVMLNIISNAIKFTERGSIAIRVSPVEEDGQAFWTITTIDTGIGMSPEVLSRIFHVFTQGNDSIQQGARGSGLGLTISREIVELMDGRLDVESIEGQGSNFRVTLPLVEASPGAGDRKPQESHFILDETRKRDFKVLLVEDNEVNRIVASGLLNEMGLEADVAVDGQEALQAAKKGVYDIILMDIHMPNLNGLEATQEIRKLPIKRAFIIALTADATAKERDICRAAGMDAFISKPIDYRILNELISSQLEGKNSLGFDIPDLRKKFQSIEQILIQTLNVYFPLFHQTKIELLKAAKEKDRRATTRIFHSLKGMILNFPAAQMHSDLQELEHRFLQAAAGEEDYESITGFLNRIEIANHDLDALLRELKSR